LRAHLLAKKTMVLTTAGNVKTEHWKWV